MLVTLPALDRGEGRGFARFEARTSSSNPIRASSGPTAVEGAKEARFRVRRTGATRVWDTHGTHRSRDRKAHEIEQLDFKRTGSSAARVRVRGFVADASLQRRELAVESGSPQASTAVATALCVSGVCHAELRSRKRSNEKGLWRGGRDSNRQLRRQVIGIGPLRGISGFPIPSHQVLDQV